MNNERVHTLIVSQYQDWLSSLSIHLWQSGFAPLTIAPTSDYALDLFHRSPPQLALIDVDTCNEAAFDLCLEMHNIQPLLPIILVQTGDTVPPYATFYTGVASYVNRELTPAAWPGLLAFILSGGMAFSQNVADAILATPPSVQRHASVLTIGRLLIDVVQREVCYGKQPVKLTPREFALLTFLARNPDRMITFDQLLNEVWGYDDNCGSPAQVRP